MRAPTGAPIQIVIATLVALTEGLTGVALAQASGDTLHLVTALEMAREMNPSLRATVLSADAAEQRISRAGALPNPMLSLGFMNWSIEGLSPSEPMSMNSVQLTQRFPWPGKLGYPEDRARHLANAELLQISEMEVWLLARVKSVYVQLAYMDRALAIMRETRELLRNFQQVASAMYAVGSGLQQDVLQAQVAIAQMTEDITAMQQNRLAMAARLNALLGREAETPIEAVELPQAPGDLPQADSLMALARVQRPALAAAEERTRAAEAGYRAARRALYPDFTVTLGYGQRPDFPDLATLMIGFSVPLFAGSNQLPLRREMQAMQLAEDARAQDLHNETYARLVELRAEAARARNLSQLYDTAVLPQARAAVESALSAYRVGGVDYMTLVQNQMTVNRYAIQSVQLTADYVRAVAQIEAMVGGELGG